MSFAHAVAFVLSCEGSELVQDAHDPGGLSRYGIALNRHPELTAVDIQNMTPDRASAIYAKDYWRPIQGDVLPEYLGLPLLDAAVNQGPGTAIKCLQRALYLTADGVIGAQTLNAAKVADPHTTLSGLTAERIALYAESPEWESFGKGWARRAVLAALEAV